MTNGRVALTERAIKHAQAFSPMVERELEPKGYLARELVQCGMPLSKPTETRIVRTNGNQSVIYASGLDKNGDPYGLPYGSTARCVQVWINTQAYIRHLQGVENPHIIPVNGSLYEFLHELEIPIVTGKRGSVHALRQQVNRLLRAQIAFIEEDNENPHDKYRLMTVAEDYDLWWDCKEPRQGSIFPSFIELGTRFFNAIIESPVPLRLHHLSQLRRSPLAIDFYVWSSYRLFMLNLSKQPGLFLPTPVLRSQLGSGFTRTRDFIKHMNEAIERVKAVHPMECHLTRNGFTLLAGPTPLDEPDRWAAINGTETRAGKTRRQLQTRQLDFQTIDAGRAVAPGFDMAYLERAYWDWVDKTGSRPANVRAHFAQFCKTHAAKNPL